MDAREALARSLRESARPDQWARLWDDLPTRNKKVWLDRADYITKYLNAVGFTIARADARKGEET